MEWLPNCLVLGITEEQFWKMNPRLIKPYAKAFEIRRQHIDSQQWFLGEYMFEAISCALGNIFRHKWESPKGYMKDMRTMPLLEEARQNSGGLTDDEKIEQTKVLFKKLEAMQAAFERSNKTKSTGES